ncbi:histidine kinase [Altererythrobacter luteolus]|uniref:histidine kinase n=1 Tax=Pontixanthobacter luteolus TaxID=295089 RepID=A0A6I4V5B7_9SPHN|nr:CHASE domain-containing protein [Pontixanthobacter luteolus]MXP47464.1 histidine kinase [Pontixanthobacter luteolus]
MQFPRAVPVAIFLLIAAITSLSVYAIEDGEHQREHAELRERAQAVASALERRGGSTASYLRAGAALFSSVDDVSPVLFNRFVSNLRVDSAYRGSEGFGWAKRLRPSEVDEFESQYIKQYGSRIEVYPKSAENETQIIPVTYIRPDNERNRRAIGYDMYSDATRRAAMDEAERTSSPIASGKLVLLQEGAGSDPGFIMYMPVFQDGRSPQRLKGFVYSPFSAQDILSSALELETRGEKGLRLYDGEVAPGQLMAEIEPALSTGLTVTEPVTIGGREMLLEVESARGNTLSRLSMLTLLFGILVATLLIVVARLLTRQALEDRASLNWFEEQNSIRNSLTRELNHRVKNTLANVLSIIALTRRRSNSLDEFADSLDGRIRALSATHDLLTQSDWGTTPIRALVEAEMAPYARHHDKVLELEGPDVELAPNDALSLGLAIHELATNAAKYGALSTAGGKVTVKWSKLTDSLAEVFWTESGGPPVPQNRQNGFGTNLIEKIVAHELRNPVELSFKPEGVTCRLVVPLRRPSEFSIRANRLK